MKKIILLGMVFLLLACAEEKNIQLAEISFSTTDSVLDHSPAYIFYNESLKDSVELNRKNLIISTNWLFNIDKRLTLKQVIPSIVFLQNKKRNAKMHKNDAAKNYFTCNNMSIKNLGFIDFTDVIYNTEYKNSPSSLHEINITIFNTGNILIFSNAVEIKSNMTSFSQALFKSLAEVENESIINLSFYNTLSFQDYISFKSELLKLIMKNTTINNEEFIFN